MKCEYQTCILQLTGQPVLIGGSMGTCSYVLTGTQHGMEHTFGSTCHGAVSFKLSSTKIRIRRLLTWQQLYTVIPPVIPIAIVTVSLGDLKV